MLVTRAMQSARASGASDEIAELTRNLDRLASQTSLSDDARRVLNRARERDMLRKAIEEDIARSDYEAAMVLVKELADRFGYRADAEEFRQRIDTLRHETLDKKVREAVSLLDGLIIQRRWDDAFAESGKIQRLYPDSHRTEGLRNRVEQARAAYKFDLERAFFIAIREDRNQEALEVFRELDPYLTTAETELYRETVKGVIGKARENLGVQFKLAVQDRRWAEASRVGEQIVHEFPNTRMAAEVRSLIDTIRTKAAGLAS
jgi:Tfp pilus assembly protein PilF